MSSVADDNKIRQNKVRSINTIRQNEHCDVADAARTNVVSPTGNRKVDVITDQSGVHRFAVDANLNADNVNVDLAHPVVCDIQNYTVVFANVEFSLDLPNGTKRFTATIRDCNGTLLVGCASGDTTGSKYRKVPMGASYNSGDVDLPDNSKVYMQTSKAGVVIELETWHL